MGLIGFLSACVIDSKHQKYPENRDVTHQTVSYNVATTLFNAMTWAGLALAALALKRRSFTILAVGAGCLIGRVTVDRKLPFTSFAQGIFNPSVRVLGGVLWKHLMPAPDTFQLEWTGRGVVVVKNRHTEAFI